MPPSQPRGAPPINDTFSGGLIGGIITAACFGVVLIVNALYKNRREDRGQQHDSAMVIITRQEQEIARRDEQIVRYERLMEDHQGIVGRIVERHTACREENAELRAYGNLMRERVERCQLSCDLGRKWGPVPPVPPPRPRPPEDVAFLARTAAQDVELARGVDERLKRKKPPDPRGSGT
jgi:hypothetical protein